MKTPTPTIFVDSTFAAQPYLSGWVGTINSDGTATPEPNAYIYIYINGFLVNPPSFDQNGVYNLTKIFSDSNGNWQTTNSLLYTNAIYLNKGSVVTVKAKSQRKDISDLSTPYVIQGMVTPINLGVPVGTGL